MRLTAAPAAGIGSSAWFQTPFQNEAEFIVEAVVTDLAEQMSYAAWKRLPEKKEFWASAIEKPGSPLDRPVYEVRVRLARGQGEVKKEVSIDGPIWSPAVYRTLVEELARVAGVSAPKAGKAGDTQLLAKLMDGKAETIENENQRLSAALETNFTDPQLHEQAALLLGAFVQREASGYFFELRSPLSRITAHLAMAQFLRGAASLGSEGRVAEVMLLTTIGNQAAALARLDALGTNDTSVAAMGRALRAFNTGDYRPLAAVEDRSLVEDIAWYASFAAIVGSTPAWVKLNDDQKQTVDFVRCANCMRYSIQTGHELLRSSIPLELEEINRVYELAHNKELEPAELVKALNELPERCFIQTGQKVRVRVIGWGQWAMFFQRHLCHALQQNFYFLEYAWSVPERAKEFSAEWDREYGGLRLYPLVRRFNCTDAPSYRRSVDDSLKLVMATPHLVPTASWNQLAYKMKFAPFYSAGTNHHISQWHSHNPPPGTVYDLNPRLDHASLISRPDAVARFEKLHALAPYNYRLANFILTKKYNNRATYEEMMSLYGNLLPYSVVALQIVASSVTNRPEKYEELMLEAASLNPAYYYLLGDYARSRHQEDKAAEYVEKGCAADPNAVRVSHHALSRVRYFLRKGQIDKAREIADEAGEVYSFAGLDTKAIFLEATTNYDGAFEWFQKIEERYDNSLPLVNFCLRHMATTGDRRFQPEVKKRLKTLFPKGMESVAVQDLRGPPADGVLINEENELLKSSGLRRGDVIVAVYGVRVHGMAQYVYARELKRTPEMDLIVWQKDAYREFKPSPPHHRFGLEFRDYVAKPPEGG